MRLIDAEALKKALKEKFDDFIPEGVYDEINNAPAVEPEITNEDLQAAMTESYHLGYELAETKFKRPQGEWIITDIGFARCPFCNYELQFPENYCGYCGADMRGEDNG